MKRWIGFLLFGALGFSVCAATNSPIRDLQITKGYSVGARIFDLSVDMTDLEKGAGYFVQATINMCRRRATSMGHSSQSIAGLSGSWLEFAVLLVLKENKLTPAYWQAEFEVLPANFNDVMVWTKEHGPIILSCKTSLRERYKQADLEAVTLRAHFPSAKFFLITLDGDKPHVARIRKKIAEGEVAALQAVYDESNLDDLVAFLKTLTLTEPDATILHDGKLVR